MYTRVYYRVPYLTQISDITYLQAMPPSPRTRGQVSTQKQQREEENDSTSYRRVTVQARTVGAPGPKQPSLHRRRPCRCGSCATSRTSKPPPPKCKQYHQHPIYINNIVRNKASNDKDFILLTIYLD